MHWSSLTEQSVTLSRWRWRRCRKCTMQEQNMGFTIVYAAYSVVIVVSKEWTSKVTATIADTNEEFLYVWPVTEILRFATENEYYLFTTVTPLCFIYQPINDITGNICGKLFSYTLANPPIAYPTSRILVYQCIWHRNKLSWQFTGKTAQFLPHFLQNIPRE
jgi:hypothetical protein